MGDIVGIFGIFGSLYTFSKNTWAWNVKRDLETLFQPLCQSRRQSTSSYTRENLSYGSVFLETAKSVGGVVYDSMIFSFFEGKRRMLDNLSFFFFKIRNDS